MPHRLPKGILPSISRNDGQNTESYGVIRNLYWNQVANLRVDGEHNDYVKIFNLYSERILNEALDGMNKGILINGLRLNNIRYADDTIVFADNLKNLQALVDKITHYNSQYGLEVNVNKTQLMIISKQKIPGSRLFLDQATRQLIITTIWKPL